MAWVIQVRKRRRHTAQRLTIRESTIFCMQLKQCTWLQDRAPTFAKSPLTSLSQTTHTRSIPGGIWYAFLTTGTRWLSSTSQTSHHSGTASHSPSPFRLLPLALLPGSWPLLLLLLLMRFIVAQKIILWDLWAKWQMWQYLKILHVTNWRETAYAKFLTNPFSTVYSYDIWQSATYFCSY